MNPRRSITKNFEYEFQKKKIMKKEFNQQE